MDEAPTEQPPSDDASGAANAAPGRDVSRRGLLRGALFGGIGGVVAGGAIGGATGWQLAGDDDTDDVVDLSAKVPFYGQTHQGGVETPPQRHCMFTSFRIADTATTSDLQVLLARWSAAISVLQQGKPIGSVQPTSAVGMAGDTGEAFGLSPARLTVTVGLGPAVFGERFGLQRFRPAKFGPLPHLNGDLLDPQLTGGDISVFACAEDPQVAYHAARNLTKMGSSVVSPIWAVLGFGRASAGAGQQTPRNLMGFKDGTRNLKTPEEFNQWVWVNKSDQPWMNGGTYQIVRKIRMLVETWDTARVGNQQDIFGRDKEEGAPLTGTNEFDTPDFGARGANNNPIIGVRSHISLAAHENNDGIRIHRRSYNYTEGLSPEGQLDAGLLFVSHVNDPQHFITLQNRLGASDLLNEYIRHIGSAIFVVPPGPDEGHYIGEALFT